MTETRDQTSWRSPDHNVKTIHPHDLAKELHTTERFLLLDCQPVLAYNSCHITGAVNVNLGSIMKPRFVAGIIGLEDLVTSDEGKEKFKMRWSGDTQMVVYDESTGDTRGLTTTHSVCLVLRALENMGRCTFLLKGGLTEFNVLHPSLCEMNIARISAMYPPLRATTPGVRDQPLDWKSAPPVHVLSFLILGSEKDAQSKDVIEKFSIQYVLNVTHDCPHYFEDKSIIYKRISVTDTGSQKLIHHFTDACAFIESARTSNSNILIHCKAGISRSVTLTIAYLMSHFNFSMQDAYQFVKEKRPAISPNLNFMGQLVAFEKELKESGKTDYLYFDDFLPSAEQEFMTAELKRRGTFSKSDSITILKPHGPQTADSANTRSPPAEYPEVRPFTLKMPGQRFKKVPKKVTNSRDNLADQNCSADMLSTSSAKVSTTHNDCRPPDLSNDLVRGKATSFEKMCRLNV